MAYRPFTAYEQYIYLSRYSRWIDGENRRETWPETVGRVMDALKKQTDNNPGIGWKQLHQAILNRDVMPSMRLMMTAGTALDLNHIAIYNCAFTDVDSIEVFSEILYVLMHGTGVGFSVRQESMDKLPTIGETNGKSINIIVGDSKEGWAASVKDGLELLVAGYDVSYDYTRIRPAGARLRTFGGRASGPAPLMDLHDYLGKLIGSARGRKLTTRECHGIVCKIAQVVVVGGVRRSALISLSDLSDQSMAEAKSGEWWIDNGHYALANNSAVYLDKPTEDQWEEEWDTIVKSGSGERGIVNLFSARKKCLEIGRNPDPVMGTNPCGEILLRSGQFCNLTEVVVRPGDTSLDILEKVRMASVLGTIQSSFDNIKGLSDKWVTNTKEERLLGVSLTGIMDNPLTADPSPELLSLWRGYANDTNVAVAAVLGINPSAAVTTIKPSGTVSQLCGTSSGIHPAHANSYIRRVRGDKKDPLTMLMIDEGVPGDTDFYNENAHVFEFGIKRPGKTRDDYTALQFLEVWLRYKKHWTDHNPSVTVSVKEHEWAEVGQWVYDNFDEVGGLSFLPYADSTYVQMPYETSNDLPEEVEVDFSKLPQYESEDNTTDELGVACSSGQCLI